MGTRTRAVLSALLLAALVAAGCSDGDGDEGADGADSDETSEAEATADDSGDSNDDRGEDGDGDDASGDGDGGGSGAPGGSDPALRQEYIDALVASADVDDTSGFDSQAVECLSTAFVDAAGTDALSAAVSPEELGAAASPSELDIAFPDGAGDAFYDQLSDCIDMRELMATTLAGGDDTMRSCVGDALDDEMIKDYFVAAFIDGLSEDDPELLDTQQRINDAVEPCLPEA